MIREYVEIQTMQTKDKNQIFTRVDSRSEKIQVFFPAFFAAQ